MKKKLYAVYPEICPRRKECEDAANSYRDTMGREYEEIMKMLVRCKPATCLYFKKKAMEAARREK